MSATNALFTLNSSLEQHDIDPVSANASGVTGVCFVRDPKSSSSSHTLDSSSNSTDTNRDAGNGDKINDNNSSSDNDSSSDDDDFQPLQFRCSNLLLGPSHHTNNKDNKIIQTYQQASHISAASYDSLSGAVLASCHQDGSCKLWDLATRRCIVKDICRENPRGGSGLALRRLGNDGLDNEAHQFLYQTRDPLGMVSLHDLNRPCTPLVDIHTFSSSFCAMSPCQIGSNVLNHGSAILGGAHNLVALPTEEHSVAVVRDLRCNPQSNPAWTVSVGDEYISSMYGTRRKYGMLTSLALCLQDTTQRIVLGCGMENGSALFYDLGAIGHGREPWWVDPGKNQVKESDTVIDSRYMCSTTLGKDPVLCLDLASSYEHSDNGTNNEIDLTTKGNKAASLVAVGGCAGDADELSELPEKEQGTVSTIKVKMVDESSAAESSDSSSMKASIRAKTRTCSIDSGGKVGVSICRFRPDGRVFAVGGWDHRLRIFGRTSSKPLAILRGHQESVTAMDWTGNAAFSGLLATGAGDGKVCIWRVFPHSSKN